MGDSDKESESFMDNTVNKDVKQIDGALFKPDPGTERNNYMLVSIVGALQVSLVCLTIFLFLGPTWYLPNQYYPDRPYTTQLYLWLKDHRNSHGLWYSHIVAAHGATGYPTYLTIFVPLFFTIHGGYYHVLFGYVAYVCLGITLAFAGLTEIIYSGGRGVNSCQFHYYSFPLFITLMFIPWYMWLCELSIYAHTSVTYRKAINGEKHVPKSLKNFLLYLSFVSMIFCVGRIPVQLGLLIDKKQRECSRLADMIVFGMANIADLGGLWWSIRNIQFIKKSMRGEVTDWDWKQTHGRSMTVVFILYSFVFCGLIMYRFLDINKGQMLYVAILYAPLVPLMIYLLLKWDKERVPQKNEPKPISNNDDDL